MACFRDFFFPEERKKVVYINSKRFKNEKLGSMFEV
jgi:hypothetical protein